MSDRLRGNAVNTPAFIKFVKQCEENGISVHSFRHLRGGVLVSAADFAPYTGNEKMHVYSLSKTFTSIAAGIALDENLLSLDDKVCDIFPEKMPSHISDNLAAMTLRDLLSMQSGHSACVFNKLINSDDSLKAFFETDVPYTPGTKFVYSSAGTLVCGAAVTRKSGENLADYLDKRMFSKMGIEKPYWECTPDGLCHGGVGLRIAIDSVAKVGQMLLDGGAYNGERIVSEAYVKDASSFHALDATNVSPDWLAGYGYQIWLNRKSTGGYRAGGAFGQFCVVLPETNEVFAIFCECDNMQKELEIIVEYIHDSLKPDLTAFEEAYKLTETSFSVPHTAALDKRIDYLCDNNASHIYAISLIPDGERLVIELNCDYGKRYIICGNGEYIHNSFSSIGLAPSIAEMHRYGSLEQFNAFAAYQNEGNGIEVTLRHSDLPHTQKWLFSCDKLTITTSCGEVAQSEYALKRK